MIERAGRPAQERGDRCARGFAEGAAPPSFACVVRCDASRRMTNRAARGFADLARGLIAGTLDHDGEAIRVTLEDLRGAKTHLYFHPRKLE